MIFLVQYERAKGLLVSITSFADSDRDVAATAKLDLEISLLTVEGAYEVVLLEAESQDALRKTHGRYFNTLEQMKSADRK